MSVSDGDTFALIARERRRLADALDELSPEQWEHPSLCAGWSAHVVAAHLNAPWEVKLPTVMVGLVKARGNLNRAFDQISVGLAERLDPRQCIAGLRENAEHRFTPPGSGPEAPLTDVIVHGADILHPLGRSVAVDAEALAVMVGWLARGNAKGFMPRGRIAGLRFHATDIDAWFSTNGTPVEGPALALGGTITGRRAYLDQLGGDGAAELSARL